MGKWLAALRESDKKSGNVTNTTAQNRQNTSEESFEGFEGSASGPFQNFQAWDDADWEFAVEERAAILEFDEGLPHPEAEALAAEQIVDKRRRQLQ
jgi:hypothetical protein